MKSKEKFVQPINTEKRKKIVNFLLLQYQKFRLPLKHFV